MKPRVMTAAVLALLSAAGAVVQWGRLDNNQRLDGIFTLWGDVFRDSSQAAAVPMHVWKAEEVRLGSRLAAQVRAKYNLDAAHQPAVLRVGNRLAFYSGPITFAAIEAPSINAFALPGGHVFVTRGLAEFVQSDDELAFVLAHEIAHIEMRHCLDGNRYRIVLGRVGAAGVGEMMDEMQRSLAISYSREQETEADERGLLIAATAGYQPKAAAALFRRLAALEPQPRAGWLMPYMESHPGALERAERIEREYQLRK